MPSNRGSGVKLLDLGDFERDAAEAHGEQVGSMPKGIQQQIVTKMDWVRELGTVSGKNYSTQQPGEPLILPQSPQRSAFSSQHCSVPFS